MGIKRGGCHQIMLAPGSFGSSERGILLFLEIFKEDKSFKLIYILAYIAYVIYVENTPLVVLFAVVKVSEFVGLGG